jgi:hypothetical protein
MVSEVSRSDWDPRSASLQNDQLAAYDDMRRRCPVAHSEFLHFNRRVLTKPVRIGTRELPAGEGITVTLPPTETRRYSRTRKNSGLIVIRR